MAIVEAMGIKLAKPITEASKKRTVSDDAGSAKSRPNTDRVQLSASNVYLREKTEARSFAAELKDKMMESPADASAVHQADYRLMDAIRS